MAPPWESAARVQGSVRQCDAIEPPINTAWEKSPSLTICRRRGDPEQFAPIVMTDWSMASFDGKKYQARFDLLAEQGQNVHGEASFVAEFSPVAVLDVGCGTGRVSIELARRGIETLGIDPDPSMIEEAIRLAPELKWIQQDAVDLDLDRVFDVVIMAGNVPLFCAEDRRDMLVRTSARHVAPGGHLVAGFQLGIDRGMGAYSKTTFSQSCSRAGLLEVAWYATWDKQPVGVLDDYGVAVFQRQSGC